MSATQAGSEPLGVFHSLVLGVVEGLTEFLPVSSTGHLILTNMAFGISDPTFEVAIQAGAITAILVLYRRRLWHSVAALGGRVRAPDQGGVNLLWLILACALPPAVIGLLFEDIIDAYLFDERVVACALVVGGFGFLVVERWMRARELAGRPIAGDIEQLTVRRAVWIGFWQTLALIPGTSRSASTIIGGLVNGLSRTAAAEFSFLVGLPILYGACLLKVAKDFERMMGPMLGDLLIAAGASFVTAIVVVGPFVRFLQRHTFRPFAYYRIALGGGLLVYFATR